MKYLEKNEDGEILWIIAEEWGRKLFLKDGTLHRQGFWLCKEAAELVTWCPVSTAEKHYRAAWDARAEAPDIARVTEDGKGYSGGHDVASSRGWLTSIPRPRKDAVLWWDATTEGRFTGYYPATVSLVQLPQGPPGAYPGQSVNSDAYGVGVASTNEDSIKENEMSKRAERMKQEMIVQRARMAALKPTFPQRHGCHCGGKGCPSFSPSGSTPGNAAQCQYSASTGRYGCPVTE